MSARCSTSFPSFYISLTMVVLKSALFFFLCGFLIVESKYIDMSFPYENNMINFPGLLPFNLTVFNNGSFQDAPFAIVFDMKLSEHTGTHIDAPVHFGESPSDYHRRATVDEIPPENLIGEAIVINITEQALKNLDYELTVEDLKSWESKHGKIPDGSILFVLTGRGKYWGDFEKYMGVTNTSKPNEFHWPGFHRDAAQWLADNRKIKGVGFDSRSLDYAPSTEYWAHRILLENNIWGLESVANIEKLPVKGARVYVMPMKIKGGSGGPARIFAQIDPSGGSSHYTINSLVLFISITLCMMI